MVVILTYYQKRCRTRYTLAIKPPIFALRHRLLQSPASLVRVHASVVDQESQKFCGMLNPGFQNRILTVWASPIARVL